MLKEFKAFLARGNVLDLAIAVIMGAAFGKIITTFTEGIVMPIVGLVTGGVDLKTKYWDIGGNIPPGLQGEELQKAIEAASKAGKPLVLYGQLLSDIVNFVIVGFVMFLLAKWAMGYFAKLAAETPPPPQEQLLAEIRDLLKAK
ncbi:MAG TPA: large conductance mechanosensitive channel protein MscL [Pyrinomonadaceae bacterium]|nr:large conductance mechanosensitive channel protein MscL [Pyrinomonadaceae bacterium]